MWRKPELRDLAAKLSQKEMNAFRESPDFRTAADPVADIVQMTAAFVRGFCRRNRQLVMCKTEYTLPESLISPAMDCAAFDVLKRLSVDIAESRNKAYDAALQLFKDVAEGGYTPESYAESEDPSDGGANLAYPHFTGERHMVLDSYVL